MVAVDTRRLLAPSLAPRLTRPGIRNVTWKPPTSTVASCSSARSGERIQPSGRHRRRHRARLCGIRDGPAASGRGGCGYCTISEFNSGALPPRAVRTVETASATFDQSSPVVCVISARRTSSSAGLRSFARCRAGHRRAAPSAHRAPRRSPAASLWWRRPRRDRSGPRACSAAWPRGRIPAARSRGRCRAACARRRGSRYRRMATSSATAAKAARHSAIGRASPLSPIPAGEASAKRSANLRRAVAASIAPCRSARSSFSASMRLSSSGRLTGGAARGGLRVDGADGELAPASPSTRSEDGSSVSGKSFATSGVVAGGKVERDDARDAGAIGIDGDGIDGRGGIDIGRPRRHGGQRRNGDQAGRDKNIGNHSHEFPPANPLAHRAYKNAAPPLVMRRCDQAIGSIEVTVRRSRRRRGGQASAPNSPNSHSTPASIIATLGTIAQIWNRRVGKGSGVPIRPKRAPCIASRLFGSAATRSVSAINANASMKFGTVSAIRRDRPSRASTLSILVCGFAGRRNHDVVHGAVAVQCRRFREGMPGARCDHEIFFEDHLLFEARGNSSSGTITTSAMRASSSASAVSRSTCAQADIDARRDALDFRSSGGSSTVPSGVPIVKRRSERAGSNGSAVATTRRTRARMSAIGSANSRARAVGATPFGVRQKQGIVEQEAQPVKAVADRRRCHMKPLRRLGRHAAPPARPRTPAADSDRHDRNECHSAYP